MTSELHPCNFRGDVCGSRALTGDGPPESSSLTVAFVAADRGGGGRTRSFFPAEALAQRGWVVRAETRPPLPGQFDILVIHRPYRTQHLALLRGQLKRGGVALVQEDDDITAVPSAGIDPRIKRLYTPEIIRRHDQAIAEAHGLICSTPALAEVYGSMARRTWVVRNYLPRWVADQRSRSKDGKVRVAWGGRVPTHLGGLEWLAPDAKRMLDGAVFLTVGDAQKTIRTLGLSGVPAEVHAFQTDVKQYYRLLGKADIGIVPLVPDEQLNLAKSALKGLEHFALGQPVVASATPEYRRLIDHGVDGFLAETPAEFADYVQALVKDSALRTKMGEAAAEKAETLWIEDHGVQEWEAVFHDVRDLRGTGRSHLQAVPSRVLRGHVQADQPVHLLPRTAERPSPHTVKMAEVPTVAVAMPSRGTMQSRTMEALFVSLARAAGKVKMADEWWAFAHGAPIPDSHEQAAERAMAIGADLVWFIEEDNVPPAEALVASVDRMRESGAGVVAVSYPVGEPRPAGDGTRWDTIYREDGEILFTGLGITLVAREVFEKLPKPWFRVDRQMGKDRKLSVKRPYTAGGVDVAFGLRVREAGFKLDEVPDMVGAHIRTVKRGDRPHNNSPNLIEIWDTVQVEQHLFRGRDSSRFTRPPNWARHFARLAAPAWIGRYQVGDHWYGNPNRDAYDPVHDPRVALCRKQFPKVKRVLELGSLEGGHTSAIAQWAEHVVGVEGRAFNLRKARLILQMYDVKNAEVRQADLEHAVLTEFGTFDLVFSVGVLYHMPDPLRLLDEMAKAAPKLFLWTHHSGTDQERDYREGGLRDPLSGLSPSSTWLPKATLLDELGQRYKQVKVLNEEETKAGPAITLKATQ